LVDDQKGIYSKEVQKHFKLKINGEIYTTLATITFLTPYAEEKS
jgi:hypothetical protein